ncbi:MAG: hypothetical protein IID08_01750 [Candidatus Hydrogenedentes bacterium]|nr:hypothetical protein [Candidatus Hydrogenedentota bacterium]
MLVLLMVVSVFVNNKRSIAIAQAKLTQHQQELAELQPIVDDYNALSGQKIALSKQVETIHEIANDRIIWSRQLFNLARLAPDNLWYEKITVVAKSFPEVETFYNEATKEHEQRTIRVSKDVLTVSGYVVPGEDGKSSISPFTIATARDEEFSALFQLDLSTFKDTNFDDVSVREFTLEYIVTPEGDVSNE